jgi:hypothetical protein
LLFLQQLLESITLGAEPASPAAEIRRADQLLPWFSANCRRARQGQRDCHVFGTPVHRGCNDSAVVDYRRIPSDSCVGERAGGRLGVRL